MALWRAWRSVMMATPVQAMGAAWTVRWAHISTAPAQEG